MNKINLILIFSFSILYADNMSYLKIKIKHNSERNGGYSHNKKIKYQYITGKVNVYSNKINIAGTKGKNHNNKITNNTYVKGLRIYGRNGYSSRFSSESQVGTVNLKSRQNRNVQKVETYIDNVRIIKRR